jgi:hypothetical protein
VAAIADGKLLVLLAGHLFLTALPGVAFALFAMRRGESRVPVLLAIMMFASGIVGLLGFWTFYWAQEIGEIFSFFVVLGSLLLGGWSLWRGDLDLNLLRRLGLPLALWALGSAFLVYLGFLHGGTAEPLAMAINRFSHPLPTDAQIPKFFADWFYVQGHRGPPPIFPGEWLASDRPPLQVGYVLSQRRFHGDPSGLDYQVLGVILQQLWIIGLWALLEAAGIGRRTKGLAMIAVLVSGLAIVNGFFIWPKMLPAAFLLAAAALVMTPLWTELRRSLLGAVLLAGLCGVAMMAHGASVFGVIPLALVAIFRGIPSWRWIVVGLAVGIVVMAPWSAYQKWGDPPGNRLTKWFLASDIEIDELNTGEAIRQAYSKVGFDGAMEYKWQNFQTMLGPEQARLDLENSFEGSLTNAVRDFRLINFYYFLPSFGLMLLAPIAMLVLGWRRRDRTGAEWKFALSCFAIVVTGAIAWGLLVFGGPEDLTVNHVGSYFLPVLGFAGAVCGLRAVLPRFGLVWTALFAVLSLALYVPALEPWPGTSYSPLSAVLAAVAIGSFVALALGLLRPPPLPRALARRIAQTS